MYLLDRGRRTNYVVHSLLLCHNFTYVGIILVKRSISVENRPRSGLFDSRSVEVGQVEKNRPTPTLTCFYEIFSSERKSLFTWKTKSWNQPMNEMICYWNLYSQSSYCNWFDEIFFKWESAILKKEHSRTKIEF